MRNSPVPVSVPILDVRGLHKSYHTQTGDTVLALTDTSFQIGDGEFVAVVGPSGKSTLLKIFTGLLPRSGGELFLHGEPITGPLSDVGVVFQDSVLLPWLTIVEKSCCRGASRSSTSRAFENGPAICLAG